MFLSTKDHSEKWGISQSRVLRLAESGRIKGAVLFGNNWMFPADAKKPADGRTREGKSGIQQDSAFRFPLFLNPGDVARIDSLSQEERLLMQGQKAFHACLIEEAKRILSPLSDNAKNRYVRIAALVQCCYIAIYENDPEYDIILWRLKFELSQDFPYKKEMMLLNYLFEVDYGYYGSILDDFSVDSDYVYHPTAFYVLLLITLIPIEAGDLSLLSRIRYDTYEALCQQMEREGHFFEAQQLHFLLLIVYQLQGNDEGSAFHIRRGLTLAMEYDFIFSAAFYRGYYLGQFDRVLEEFPRDFADRIRSSGELLHQRFMQFTESRQNPSFLGFLSDQEFEFAFLASQGYTNREIANRLNISEKTVSRKYSEIYDKLGITSKKALIEQINNTHKKQTP